MIKEIGLVVQTDDFTLASLHRLYSMVLLRMKRFKEALKHIYKAIKIYK
jgi:hypothetical protein